MVSISGFWILGDVFLRNTYTGTYSNRGSLIHVLSIFICRVRLRQPQSWLRTREDVEDHECVLFKTDVKRAQYMHVFLRVLVVCSTNDDLLAHLSASGLSVLGLSGLQHVNFPMCGWAVPPPVVERRTAE